MIRHVVLFKLKPDRSWDDPEVRRAEEISMKVGAEVEDLVEWSTGRNISTRPIAYDYLAVGLVADEAALERYLLHPFHQQAITMWREISDWVIVDVPE